jgi:hypothetical protein
MEVNMDKKLMFIIVIGILFITSCSLFNFNKVPQTAELEITGFEDGGTSTNRVISVSGTVHNPVEGDPAFLGYVHLVLNETNYDMSVTHITEDDWKIQHDVVIKNGTNKLRIKVYNSDSNLVEESPEFTLNGNLPIYPFRVELTWDTDFNDIDLHSWYYPTGDTVSTQHCWYSNKTGITNAFLDVDDVNGYGPENFTIENEVSGTYKMGLRYYSAHGVTGDVFCTVRIYKNENLIDTKTHTFTASQANGDNPSNDWAFYSHIVQ